MLKGKNQMSLTEQMIEIPAEHEANVFGQFDAYVKKLEKTARVIKVSSDCAIGSEAAADCGLEDCMQNFVKSPIQQKAVLERNDPVRSLFIEPIYKPAMYRGEGCDCLVAVIYRLLHAKDGQRCGKFPKQRANQCFFLLQLFRIREFQQGAASTVLRFCGTDRTIHS